MSSSSRPLSCSLAPETLQHCSSAPSPYFSAPSTLSTSPHSAHFSSSPSPSLSSSCSSSSSFSFSSNSNSTANFGAEYYGNHQQNLQHLSMMAATLDGNSSNSNSSMMKLYNSNPKIESGFEASWNGNNNTSSLYGSAKLVPAYQQQQPQQQLDQINFLVRKECCNEIDQAVKELGISADPFNWSISDVQKWLLWMQRWAQLPTLKLEHFAMDGMSLCALSEEDFRQRVPHGEKLYAKLEIWRMAINYFGATEVLFDSLFGGGDGLSQEDTSGHSSMTNNFSGQYCASPYSTSSTTTDASSLYSGSSPISPEGYGVSGGGSSSSGCGSLPTYAESMYGGLCSSGHSIASSPASPASSSHSSVNSCSPYGQPQQQQQTYGYGQSSMMAAPQQQQQQQYGKATMGGVSMNSDFSTNMSNSAAMISAMSAVGTQQQQRMAPTSDYGSDAIPSDDDDMSDDGKCFLDYHHQNHRMTLQQQQQLMHFQQQQMQSSTGRALPTGHLPQIKVESRNDYSPSTSPVYHQHQHGLQHHQQHLMQQQQYGHSRLAVHHQQYSHSISVVSKGELPPVSISSPIAPVPSSAAPVASAPVASAPVPVRTSSSHIHLWQFLKELLSGPHQYGSSIRWLDRSKGVFKIEDSVSVAKLWGARKNRPAMNYDKLSRSIRQYYKKGIMKKTERSQRLVYQFCANYAL